MKNDTAYHVHISSENHSAGLKLKETWEYRDLIFLFTERSFKLIYKQTILGPLWIILNPLITSGIYTIVFGNMVGLSTAGVPKFLFYICSHSLWVFFATCLNSNSRTFINNANVFSKVYFPRLTVPFSTVLSALIQLLIQLAIAVVLIIYHTVNGNIHPDLKLLPIAMIAVIMVGIMGLGLGIFVSAITTKYRDLSLLVGFGLNLFMYASPVIYPLEQLYGSRFYSLMVLNPMTAPMEIFRKALLGTGDIQIISVVSSVIFTILAFIIGTAIFNRVERSFIDTV